MQTSFDIEPTIAALTALANLMRELAFAGENIRIESDVLRLVSDSLLDLANELKVFVRDALDERIAERAEHQRALAAAKAERDGLSSPSDREQAETQRDLVAPWAKMVERPAAKRSASSALPIVVMAANLREARA
jgi:hypothetical protein